MKTLLILLTLCLCCLSTGCEQSELDFVADSTLTAVGIGIGVWEGVHASACADGRATPEQCAKWDALHPRLLAGYQATRFAWEEFRKVRGKTTAEKLRLLLTDLGEIVRQVTALADAWRTKPAG